MARRESGPSLGQKAIVELIGTFLFVFIGAGAVIAAQSIASPAPLVVAAIANGIGLALAVSFAMNISGGHINPAVTIGALVARRIPAKHAGVYIVAQIIGAVLAGALLLTIYSVAAGTAVNYGAPSLAKGVSVYQGILVEAVLTFILVFVVFGTTIDDRAPRIAGFGVGLAVMLDVLIGGQFTGAAMNPARAIGPEVAALYFANWYVYVIGPLIGAVIAAAIYEYVILREKA